MTSKELRQKYLDFFSQKDHAVIPSSSLIPENDPTTLFISAGMHPLVPYLMGEKHPSGKRLVNSQKCIRTIDIEEVGDKYHHTFFEMLGHWSLGDYFKKEAIGMSFEFLTKELKLSLDRLAFSVFAGNENSPSDEEAATTWKNLGVPEERIAYLPKEENWWELAGAGGPCGPSTEMFYWIDSNTPAPEKFDTKDKRWVEFGNDVLMQYTKQGEGKYESAIQKNIDNGTGLERTLAVLNGLDDDYETDLFKPIVAKVEELSDRSYGTDEKQDISFRIIADHIRAATFILGDESGIAPSNEDQGYILRRLIRRSIRHGKMLGIDKPFTHLVGEVVVDLMGDVYEELKRNKDFIVEQLTREEEKFSQTLERGLKEFELICTQVTTKTLQPNKLNLIKDLEIKDSVIPAKLAFYLYESFGFPLEMIVELANEKNLKVDEKGFQKEFEKHQEKSRQGAEQKFAGGLADHSEQVTAYHTATHLLHQALRQVLGEHVGQKGSNITEKRLRFDFTHSEKMTSEQIKEVEDIVNQKIEEKISIICEEMSVDEAKAGGAIGLFGHKYGEKVKVYSAGDFSREICGGPHVDNTEVLGHFKIKKEESSSAGVRRIKAILE